MSSNSGDVRHDLLPPGDALQKAVRWISDQRTSEPAASLKGLIDQASVRFDLSPLQAEGLFRILLPGNSAQKP